MRKPLQPGGKEGRRKAEGKDMVEKKMAGVLLLLAMGLFSGCGNGKEAAEGETTEIFGSWTISPAGILRVDEYNYLQFYSRESDSKVYLCNQAGCSHRDKSCSAYVENLLTAFYYDDDLYLIQSDNTHTRIQRANRYGENRQLLGEAEIFPLVFSMQIYEGKLYFIGDKWDFEQDKSSQGLYAFDLKSGEIENFPNVDTGYLISNVSNFLLTERYLYTQYTACDIDVNDYLDFNTGELQGIEWDSIVYTPLLYRTDRQTGETELLLEEAGAELTLLEAEGESFVLRLGDSILRYEGKELADTLYTYSGDAAYWQVKPFSTGYLVSDLPRTSQFRILEDFKETESFADPDGKVTSYYGAAGDALYFNGSIGNRGVLYSMEQKDFETGNYEFHLLEMN